MAPAQSSGVAWALQRVRHDSRHAHWSFPPSAWDWLFPGTYYLRAVQAKSGEVQGAWTFTKPAPARTDALASEPFSPIQHGGRSA